MSLDQSKRGRNLGELLIWSACRKLFRESAAAKADAYTPVGKHGVTLSGGQRQRLASARAFICNAPLLVLDEATASLDSQPEAEVQGAIDKLEENRTVICVAHRLSTLAKMDRIIILSHGEIVEPGTFDELLQRDGFFAAMASRQGIWPGKVFA